MKFVKGLEEWIYEWTFGALQPTIWFSIISYKKNMFSSQALWCLNNNLKLIDNQDVTVNK